MNKNMTEAPEVVELVYRVVGATHVFSSHGMKGLVHTGSCDRATSFSRVIDCLNEHAREVYGGDVSYHADMTYDEFSRHIDFGTDISANFLTLRLDAAMAA